MRFRQISIITSLALLLCYCFCFSVGAVTVKEYNLDIELPENFTIITANNIENYPEFMSSSGMDKKTFKSFTQKNGIVLYATDFETKKEITLICTANDFSAKVEDLGLLDAAATKQIGDSVFQDTEYKTITINERFKYFSSEYSDKDKGGDFYGLHFVTVRNGDIYNFSFSSPQKITDNDIEIAEKSFLSLTFKQNEGFKYADFENTLTQILIILGILCFVALMLYIIYLFIVDIKNKRNTSDVAPYVKIKRRRF